MVILIVRFMVSAHHKDDLKPLCAQRPKRLVMIMPFGPLISVVMVRPLTLIERDKSQPVRGMTHHLVARKTKVHDMALAARFGHRDHSGLSLKVVKRLPSIVGITELSPKHRYDRARFCSRQCLDKLSCRHRGEKMFDPLVVGLYCIGRSLELGQQHQKELRLGSDHMVRDLKLRLIQFLPQLLAASLTEMMLALGKAIPFPSCQIRQSPWSRILFEKIPRDLGFQIRKNLQGTRVILFERYPNLIEQPRFMTPQPMLIPKLLLAISSSSSSLNVPTVP